MTTLQTILSPDFWMILGLVIGGIAVLIPIFFLACFKWLAPRNIFFTFGRENRAMYIMTGKRFSGKVIMPSKTLYVDANDNNNIKEFPAFCSQDEKDALSRKSYWGMYWVGIYPINSINERRQQWLEWQSNSRGKRIIRVRDEMTPFLIVKPFEYTMLLEEGEDKNGVPLNVYFTIILKPTNATLPIFDNDNAYGQVQTICRSEVLLFVKEKSFANLGADNATADITNDEFASVLSKLNIQIPGRPDQRGLIAVLGYEIMDAKLDAVEIAGEQKALLLEASTAEYLAGEHAKAKVATAEGDFKSAEFEAKGKKAILDVQAEYYEKINKMPGAQEIEKRKATPGLTTLVEGGASANLLIGK